MVPLTSAPPRSAVFTLSPSNTARTRPNSTAAPTSPSSVSTSMDSPAATRYCFPPVSITAYIKDVLLSCELSEEPQKFQYTTRGPSLAKGLMMKVMTDEIIELYMRDVDRTLLRENLKLTPTQRFEQLMEMQRFAEELQRVGRAARKQREETVAAG